MDDLLQASAQYAITLLHGKPANWTAIAAQFALEKGWDWWRDPQPPFDAGNIMTTSGAGHPRSFATLEEGVRGYVDFLTVEDRDGYYAHVVEAIRGGPATQVLVALHNSPYCAPPYDLGTLLEVWHLVLARFPDHAIMAANKPKPWIIEVGYFDTAELAHAGQARILEMTGYQALAIRSV